MEHLSLWEFCEENLERGLPYWNPEGYVKDGSENGYLSP
jgi:hypothetical protein